MEQSGVKGRDVSGYAKEYAKKYAKKIKEEWVLVGGARILNEKGEIVYSLALYTNEQGEIFAGGYDKGKRGALLFRERYGNVINDDLAMELVNSVGEDRAELFWDICFFEDYYKEKKMKVEWEEW